MKPPKAPGLMPSGGVKAFEVYEAAVRNPALAAAAELKSRSEKSLIEFLKLMWHVIEPGQPLRVGRAMHAIAEHLEAVHSGQIRNLLINCPPGFSKSTLVNVFFPAWEWGPKKRPDLRYISWAYGEHLTLRDNTKGAALINSPLYQTLWGGRFKWDPRQSAKEWYANDERGFRIASGVRGMGTGERGDRLNIDDPHSVQGAKSDADRDFTTNWFGSTLTSRVRNANPFAEWVADDGERKLVLPSSTIVIMQRVHHLDVAGVILANELDFEHLLIEMEYEGGAHPVRARKSKKRPGELAWKPSRIGYVDFREAQVQAVAAIAARHSEAYAEMRRVPPASDDASRAAASDDLAPWERPLTVEECEVIEWWFAFGKAWNDIAADIAILADPVRYPRSAIEEQREKLLLDHGGNAVAAQFRQYPHEGTGDMFPSDKWAYCEPEDVPPSRVLFDVRGWDLAAVENLKSDGTGAVKIRWGTDKRFYVMHAQRVRRDPGGVRLFREEIRNGDGPGVIQDFPRDPGQAGVDQVMAIAQEDPGTVTRASPETGSKTVRAMPASGHQHLGLMVLVRGPWNDEYKHELSEFPNSAMNALVDATSRAFNRLAHMPVAQVPGGSSVEDAPTRRESQAAKVLNPPTRNMSLPSPEIDSDLDDDLD